MLATAQSPRLHAPAADVSEALSPPAVDAATWARVRALWSEGAAKVVETSERSGLNRNELYALMDAGAVAWMHKDAKRTRVIAWASVVDHLTRMYLAWLAANPEHAPPDGSAPDE